jgi:Xaa-Pro aminopeptidase
MDFQVRREKARKLVKKAGAEALLVSHHANVHYLTGFTGHDAYLLLRKDGQILISDGRFPTQIEEECPGLEMDIRKAGVYIHESTSRVLKTCGIKRLAFEAESMTVAMRDKIAELSPQLEMGASSGLVESLREIKDEEEISEIRSSIALAQDIFEMIRADLKPEQTEAEIAAQIDYQIRVRGGTGPSFPPIVAVGSRAALPHATPTQRKIGEDDFVLFDWGAARGQYRSDLTRTLATGKISPKLRRVYGVVLEAQTRAIAAIRPGVKAQEIDQAARSFITDAKMGPRFNHGLGHGLGLETHESPRLSGTNASPLRAGMVITIEPGIYLPDWGGVRIEDDVLVTRTGHEVLSSLPKQLEEMVMS